MHKGIEGEIEELEENVAILETALADLISSLDQSQPAPEIQREDVAPLKETRILSAAETR